MKSFLLVLIGALLIAQSTRAADEPRVTEVRCGDWEKSICTPLLQCISEREEIRCGEEPRRGPHSGNEQVCSCQLLTREKD